MADFLTKQTNRFKSRIGMLYCAASLMKRTSTFLLCVLVSWLCNQSPLHSSHITIHLSQILPPPRTAGPNPPDYLHGLWTVFRISHAHQFSVLVIFLSFFTCVSYAEARNRYRLDVCSSICLSVCPSHAGIVSKRLNILS